MTRDEWCQIWESIQRIKLNASHLSKRNIDYPTISYRIKADCEFIKDKIQQEIGQME